MSTLANFLRCPEKRIVTLEFSHPSMIDIHDLVKAVNRFEDDLHEIEEDERFDFLVIKTDNGLKSSEGLHRLFIEELNVKEISKWEKIVTTIEKMRKITIIALPDIVDDTLFQLALACDYALCKPNTSFKFSSIKDGYLPGMAVFRLTKYVGLGRAKRIILSGMKLSAKAALRAGIVKGIVENLNDGINKIIKQIEPKQIEAMIMAKLIMTESFHDSYEDEIGNYLAAQVRCSEHLKKLEAQAEIEDKETK